MLCGINPATSREHVPPESFFEPPYPSNLITVPSCSPCNQGSHLDDDYFLAFLVSRDYSGTPPVLESVRERVYRGLRRADRPGLQIRLLDASTPEGERLRKVLKKQVRGLAFHLTGRTVLRSTYMEWSAPSSCTLNRLSTGICG